MESGSSHIVLIGLRGSGKSTVGAILARRLELCFIDLDDRTPGYADASSVAEVFERIGEAGFREAEHRALIDALGEQPSVISLGGGTPTAPGAAELLTGADARLFYLRAQPNQLRARLSGDDNTHRPALVGDDVLSEIEEVFATRDALYTELADTVIDTDGLDTDLVVDAVIDRLGESGAVI